MNLFKPFLRADSFLPWVVLGITLVGLGSFTGYLLSGTYGGRGVLGNKIEVAPGAKVSGNEAGLRDEKTFRDSARGKLEKGGIDGEGTHHLLRDGGPAQFVYLTSSVIDLDDFVGRRVEVWGETHKGQKAGWLMDVGRVKVVE